MDKKLKFAIFLLIVTLLAGGIYPIWIEKNIIIDILIAIVATSICVAIIAKYGPTTK